MALSTTRWSPFQQMERMQRELDRLFAHVTAEGEPGRRRGWLPAVDVEQTADAMVLKADLPGIPRDAISIEVHDGSLTISGEREEERHDEHEGYVVHERISGSFARSFALPPRADVDNINAVMEDGVLKVTIPRPTEESPRRITVG
jgi:HSP20 family protein